MIAPNSKILALDLGEGEPISTSIADLYKRYSYLARDDIINPRDLRITDWTGWTELTMITKSHNNCRWFRISTPHAHIDVSENNIIPIYAPQHRKIGFHGEVLYRVKMVPVFTLPNPDPQFKYVRVRDIATDDGLVIQFEEYHIEEIDPIEYGYNLRTRSGYFNANRIHAYADLSHMGYDDSDVYK